MRGEYENENIKYENKFNMHKSTQKQSNQFLIMNTFVGKLFAAIFKFTIKNTEFYIRM